MLRLAGLLMNALSVGYNRSQLGRCQEDSLVYKKQGPQSILMEDHSSTTHFQDFLQFQTLPQQIKRQILPKLMQVYIYRQSLQRY